MGTRSLIAAKIDGDLKVAQYSQWGGWPPGQGALVLEFLAGMDDAARENFLGKLRATRWATEEDLTKAQAELDAIHTLKVGHLFPEYDRDTGAKIFHLIAQGAVTVLKDSRTFAGDGLFCEWAYLVDFDRDVLEVYTGFGKGKAVGYFADYEATGNGYSAVSLVKSFDLGALPSETEFVSAFQDEEDSP